MLLESANMNGNPKVIAALNEAIRYERYPAAQVHV